MVSEYVARTYMAWNLEEAAEELERLVVMIQPDAELDEVEFRIRMARLYSHVNTAWNARLVTNEEFGPTDEQFQQWRQFPADLEV